ncbi:MAG: hypothetical protein MI922_19325, partial [Bacteroidales bacterium]|nr:hypothetical protein [Bacteroidales bacterium]
NSKVAADEITNLAINTLKLAEEASNELSEMLPEVANTAVLVQEIAASGTEQSRGTTEINNAIQQMNSVTQQNATASEQLASSSEELATQAMQLQHLISYFKVNGHQKEDFNSTSSNNDTLKIGKLNKHAVKPGSNTIKTSESYISL